MALKVSPPLDLPTGPRRRPAGQGAGSGTPIPPQPVIFPPEVYPIPGAVLFQPSAQNVAVTNAAVVVLVSQVIPAQSHAVIRRVQFGLDSMTIATLISWTLRGNQGALTLQPYSIQPARAATFTGDDQDTLIRVPQGVTVIDMIVTVDAADPSSYQVGAMFTGWYWTKEQEAAYRAGVL